MVWNLITVMLSALAGVSFGFSVHHVDLTFGLLFVFFTIAAHWSIEKGPSTPHLRLRVEYLGFLGGVLQSASFIVEEGGILWAVFALLILISAGVLSLIRDHDPPTHFLHRAELDGVHRTMFEPDDDARDAEVHAQLDGMIQREQVRLKMIQAIQDKFDLHKTISPKDEKEKEP